MCVHVPCQVRIRLGIINNAVGMTMSIPPEKLDNILIALLVWDGNTHTTYKQMQSIVVSLKFDSKVSPPGKHFFLAFLCFACSEVGYCLLSSGNS